MTTLTTPQPRASRPNRAAIALISALAVGAIGVSAAIALPRLMTSQPTVTRPDTSPTYSEPNANTREGRVPMPTYNEQVPPFTATQAPVTNRTGATTLQFQHGHGGVD